MRNYPRTTESVAAAKRAQLEEREHLKREFGIVVDDDREGLLRPLNKNADRVQRSA